VSDALDVPELPSPSDDGDSVAVPDELILVDEMVPTDGSPDSSDWDVETITADAGQNSAFKLCGSSQGTPVWLDEAKPGVLSASCFSHKMDLTFLSDSIVRIRYEGQQPDPAPDRSFAVVAEATDEPTWIAALHGDGVRICTEELMIEISDQSCRLLVADRDGNVLIQDGPDGGYSEGPLEGDSNQPWALTVRRMISGTEHFYGFGEKNGPLDKRGRSMWFYNSDVPGYNTETDPLYQSVPFFIGLRDTTAYGVFTDNSYRVRMDMGLIDPAQYAVSALGGEIDQYIILGPAIADVVQRYTWLTGRMSLPPRWSLGYQQSRYGYKPASQITSVAQELRSRNIPSDGMWLDIDYMDEYRCWTWSPDFTADPTGFVAELKAMGFRTTVIIDPGLKVDPDWPIYQYGLDHELYLKNPDGTPFEGQVWPGASVFPDFTNPETRAWWGTLIPGVTDAGVEGLWLDMNEPANFMNEFSWTVPDWLIADGEGVQMTMAEAHNLYGSTMAHATYDGLRALFPDRRPFILTRAGYAGIQRYAAVWTGDVPANWPALESTLPMLLGMGLSGVPFVGSDAGGWSGGADAQLFTRWMQLGALSPFFRNHSDKNAEPREPWAFGPVAEGIIRDAIEQRYRLLPYWYALFEESSRTGSPILRPMLWEFQHDQETHALSHQAMLGPWLLVAPVLQPDASVRSVYLPAGDWFEYRSGRRYVGPGMVEVPVILNSLPMLVRSGGIIPHQNLLQWTDQAPVDLISIELYPDETESQFSLYEDDGISVAYAENGYLRTPITLQKTATGATLTWGPAEGAHVPSARTVLFRVRRALGSVQAVEVNGAALPQASTHEELMASGGAWYHDPTSMSLEVALADPGPSAITFLYEHLEISEEPPAQVNFRIEAPPEFPGGEDIYVAISLLGWVHVPMEWSATEPGVAELTLSLPLGAWFEYKYTRGDWSTVEKQGDCAELNNRVGFGYPGQTIQDTVAAWADLCL
jgi:alpha-glucosidase